jgi:hypothetical protein
MAEAERLARASISATPGASKQANPAGALASLRTARSSAAAKRARGPPHTLITEAIT